MTSTEGLAKYIDHTLLSPEADLLAYEKLCTEALTYSFYGVCVTTASLLFVREALLKSNVKKIVVVGFPHGNVCSEAKVFETKWAIDNGADEIDMVALRSAYFSGNLRAVQEDVSQVVQAASGAAVKVILETASLNSKQIKELTLIAADAGAAFIKTSTGYCGGGAVTQQVELIVETLKSKGFGNSVKVKASGGIRSADQALAMIAAGAQRLGASASVAIVKGNVSESDQY